MAGQGRRRPPSRDALLVALLMQRSTPADRKHLLRILRRAFGGGASSVNGLDPDGNPEDLSPRKAREILRHGSVRGHRLTPRQRRYMGAVAGGKARK